MSGTYSALRDAAPTLLLAGHAYRRPNLRFDPPEPHAPAPTDPAPVVAVAGSTCWTDPATVRVALTWAWRDLGRPITVAVGPEPYGPAAVAREWVAEHACCGIRLADDHGPPDHPDLVLTFPAPHPRPNGLAA